MLFVWLIEDDEKEPSFGGEDGDSEDDGTSPPAAGNTEGEGVPMSKKELKEARGKEKAFR